MVDSVSISYVISDIRPVKLVSSFCWGFLFGLILILWVLFGVLFGVPFGPGVCFGVDFGRWGRRFGLAGKGTVAQSGCQEAFGTPPRLQIRIIQGSRATGKRGSNSVPRLQIRIAGCEHKGRQQ